MASLLSGPLLSGPFSSGTPAGWGGGTYASGATVGGFSPLASSGASTLSSSTLMMGAQIVFGIVGALSKASTAYNSIQLENTRAQIASEQRSFDFSSSQYGRKFNLQQQAHQLTTQQFDLKLAQFGMESDAIKYEAQALSDDYSASMSDINARQAEKEAQSILESANQGIGWLTAKVGQEKEAFKTQAAARGVVLGDGSTAEVVASMDLIKEMDAMTMKVNAVYASGQKRAEVVQYQNNAEFARMSADSSRLSALNARSTSGVTGAMGDIAGNSAAQINERNLGIDPDKLPGHVTYAPQRNPKAASTSSLIESATNVASSWYTRRQTIENISRAIAGA